MLYYYTVTCHINGLMDDGYIRADSMHGLYAEHKAHGYITSYFPVPTSIN